MEANNIHSQSKNKHRGTNINRVLGFFLNQSYQVLVSILLFYSVLIAFNSFISMIFFLALYFVHSHIQLLFTEIFHLLYGASLGSPCPPISTPLQAADGPRAEWRPRNCMQYVFTAGLPDSPEFHFEPL